jgi:hypothetical protein
VAVARGARLACEAVVSKAKNCEADPFASALYTATPTSASETMDGQFTRKSADRRKACHTFVPAHHGLASEARSTGHSRAAKSSFFNHLSPFTSHDIGVASTCGALCCSSAIFRAAALTSA